MNQDSWTGGKIRDRSSQLFECPTFACDLLMQGRLSQSAAEFA
jgi:hypothetical protein